MIKTKFLKIIFLISLIFPTFTGWAQNIDDQIVRVGILTHEEFTTVRAQSFSGHWQAHFCHKVASGAAQIASAAITTVIVAEGEDLAVSLTRKGILGKISTGKEINVGYDKVIITGGELLSIEIPGAQPMLLHGDIEFNIREEALGAVNHISLHKLLVSCVSRFGLSSEIEALKAFIVMARTRIVYLKGKSPHPDESFDICDHEHCLPFAGAGYNRELVDILVNMTANKIITYKDKPIFPRYHHTCGGKISSAKDLLGIDEEPYHVQMEDRLESKGSENCFHSPGFHWSVELSKLDILDFLSLTWAGGADRIFTGWEPLVIDNTGRIAKALIRGRRPKEVNGIEFFERMKDYFGPNSMKSMRFSMEVLRRSVIFRGMGQGNGIGMCLYGADGQAKKGRKYDEILGFYYPGTVIK
jgi:SpoIID/LytB domain protein